MYRLYNRVPAWVHQSSRRCSRSQVHSLCSDCNIAKMPDLMKIKQIVRKSLEACPVGTDEENLQNGRDFYKFMFGNYPQLRVYFKGAENYTPEDVQKSERFQKQGQRILLAVHVVASCADDPIVFKGYIQETVNRHRQYKMDPALWLAFFTVFVGFLETKKTVTEEEKAAWAEFGKLFNEEALTHLARLGLPH
uniref:Globin family profile domain-containing protein n=1 Tax=Plectus sambesii TaxID=2011161 RepID=A0A914WJW4_9BILA